MKTIHTLSLLCLLTAGNSTLAQTHNMGHDNMPASSATATARPMDMVAEGEVRKVDKSAGKITLKHGEIRNLDMPPMTMVFRVKEPALLDKVKAGDKVLFTAEENKGALTVLTLEPMGR